MYVCMYVYMEYFKYIYTKVLHEIINTDNKKSDKRKWTVQLLTVREKSKIIRTLTVFPEGIGPFNLKRLKRNVSKSIHISA